MSAPMRVMNALGTPAHRAMSSAGGKATQANRRAMKEAIEFTDQPWKDPQNILKHLASQDSQHVHGPHAILNYLKQLRS